MVRLNEKTESDAVDALKQAAMKLFAERGVDGVTVREIAAAAGQRNHGAVGYHFGSKADLIRTLIVDGAELINRRRNSMLDALEASGAPVSLEEVIGVMVFPSIDLTAEGEEECYNRFIVLFSMAHRAQFLEALAGSGIQGSSAVSTISGGSCLTCRAQNRPSGSCSWNPIWALCWRRESQSWPIPAGHIRHGRNRQYWSIW